jgi:GNAT superfamily N-acetyltransferase
VHLRIANKNDAAAVSSLFQQLFHTSIYSSLTTYKPEDVIKIVEGTVEGDPLGGSCILLIEDTAVVGALLCSVLPHLFNHEEKTAVELGFYIIPEYRNFKSLKLILGAYKYWAKVAGCKTIMYGKVTNKVSTEDYIIRKLK